MYHIYQTISSSTASVSSNPKIKTIVQASPSATDIDADKSKSDTATKIMTKQFLATGDSHLSEQSVSPESEYMWHSFLLHIFIDWKFLI